MKSPPICTSGLIIGSFESGEKDKIIRLLGEKTGKISAIAKRCRGSNIFNSSSKSPVFTRQPELFDYGDFYLSSGHRFISSSSSTLFPSPGGLYTLQHETTLKPPFSLSDSMAKIVLASFLVETVDALTTDSNPDDGCYLDLALEVLQALSQTTSVSDKLKMTFYSLLKLLNLSGFGLPPERHVTTPTKRNLRAIIKHITEIRGFELQSESSIELLLSKI